MTKVVAHNDSHDDNGDEDGGDVERYEQLRCYALSGNVHGHRQGLGVVASRGVVAWLRVCRAAPSRPTPRPPERSAAGDPAAGVADRVVEALASMALAAAGG